MFTTNDLKSGMLVELRNGNRYTIEVYEGGLFGYRREGYIDLNMFNDDMTSMSRSVWDIVKVWGPTRFCNEYCSTEYRPVVYEREVRMTLAAIEAVVGHPVEIVDDV